MVTTSTTSSSSSATQNLVAALGAGSGIDMAALANNLAVAQFAGRTDRLTAKSEKLEAQISAASNLKSMMLSLSTSLGDRIRMGDLSRQPSVANGPVARASLSGSGNASGNYSLEVTTLATSQTLASPAYPASTSAVGAGTLTLRFGDVTSGSFAEDAGHAAVSITIANGATLADVARAVNSANAGVSAYVAQTTSGAQLVFKGQEGQANGFVIDVAEDAAEPGLSNLAWAPGTATGQLMTTAGNAAFKVDGLEMTSASNKVVDAIPGVTLQLTGTNAAVPTTLSFSDPTEAITGTMQDLTSALNEIAAAVKQATDPKTGELARDGGARALQRSLSGLAGKVIMSTSPEGTPRTLSDLGLKTQRDGSFQFDAEQLSKALASDPDAVAAMFTTGLFGIYGTIDSISRTASATGNPGSLTGSITRYTQQLTQVAEDQAEIAERQEDMRARLVARFAVSENRISSSQATLTFLQNQIAAWNSKDS